MKDMRIQSEAEMLALGRALGQLLDSPAAIELVGDVGAGKTTFTRGLAQGLGITEPITSPSFTISKRYATPAKSNIGELVHYDFYRLSDPGIMRSELAETIAGQNLVVIEWGTAVANLLPEQHIRLDFRLHPDGSRSIKPAGIPEKMWKTCVKAVENTAGNVDKGLGPGDKNQLPVENLHEACVQPVENFWSNCAKPVENSQNPCGKLVQNCPKSPKSSEKPNSGQTSRPDQQPSTEAVLSGFRCDKLSAVPLFLDTSTDLCRLQIGRKQYSWPAKHDLAEKIFRYIHTKLQAQGYDWTDLTEIHFFAGPGSFTGLRIGAAIVNVLADQLDIPLFDQNGEPHQLILPDYGRPAHISAPRK